MRFIIKSKTPIFTGDIGGKSNYLRETGIIGSMRWWYEALVRGFGGSACDPTVEGFRCPQEGSAKDLCDACYLFGATGQAKRFLIRVESSDGNTVPDGRIHVEGLTDRGWYLPTGWYGNFLLLVKGLRGNDDVEVLIKALLTLQANWGGIGARNYLGYGIFNLFDENEQPVEVTTDELQRLFVLIDKPRDNRRVIKDSFMKNLPSLRRMFFYKLTFDQNALDSAVKNGNIVGLDQGNTAELVRQCRQSNFIPISANVRHALRNLFRGLLKESNPLKKLSYNKLKEFRYKVIGTREPKQGAKIAASHLYKSEDNWKMRIWGYIPSEKCPDNVRYQDTDDEEHSGVDAVKAFLSDVFGDEQFWSDCFGVGLTFAEEPIKKQWSQSMEYKEFVSDLILNSCCS